jgi:predicted dehydrogenase
MKVGLIGTGAIANKHAQAYKNIGYQIVAVSNKTAERGQAFANQWGSEFFADWADVCRHPEVDFVDICTFPDVRLEPLKVAADNGKHVQVQKPIAIDVATARNAGVAVWALPYGYNMGEPIESCSPDRVIADFSALRSRADAA